MNLLIIRHGESEADLLNVHEGWADFELTDKGHEQAKRMGNWIKARYTITKIYTSPLKRAFQTSLHLSAATGIQPQAEPLLMEFNNGLLAGLSREEAAAKYPYVPDLPIHQALYEQESLLMFRYRADAVLSQILSENGENTTIAVVSHGGMINQLFRSFLKLPVDSNLYIQTGDTGIHEWHLRGKTRSIVYANSCAHLSG